MKKVSALLILFFLLLPLTARAETCATTTNTTVAVGEECGTLGASQVLSDGTGLLICLVSDTDTSACSWTKMASTEEEETGNSGDLCGHLSLKAAKIASNYSSGGDTYYYCSYSTTITQLGAIQCAGSDIVSAVTTTSSATPATGYEYIASLKTGRTSYSYLHVAPSCPDGYSLVYWASNTTAATKDVYPVCTDKVIDLVCVRD